MNRSLSALFVVVSVFSIAPSARAEIILPPGPPDGRVTVLPYGPDWWRGPGAARDGVTRTQMHSFHQNPNDPGGGDYTYDGYPPTVTDEWGGLGGISQYNRPIPNSTPYPFVDRDGRPFGDGIGAFLPESATLTKRMGNRHVNDEDVKVIFLAIIWKGAGSLSLDVTAPGSRVSVSQTNLNEGNGWHVSWLRGTISPQPNQEMFSFSFGGEAWIDSVWAGTHCIPEPSALALLAAGVLVAHRRRRVDTMS